MKQGLSFLEDFILINDLKMGIDFEVVSFLAITPNQLTGSADRYLGIDVEDVLRFRNATDTFHYLINLVPPNEKTYITPTPFKDNVKSLYFFKLRAPLNLKFAIGCGLGVVRMLKGTYQNQYLFYSIDQVYNDQNNDIFSLATDIFRLKLYMQLVLGKKFHDKAIEKEWKNNQLSAFNLLMTDQKYIHKQLEKIFS
ncbi:hypothetical protein [Amphibacillus sediminis]|uniref:hypothetical protein n=1 Tax=Amphibacillus sediminis TaxID=360185 RepID=UPI00083188E0|nr:hypothetical protein [Amphibacillus sediminis]